MSCKSSIPLPFGTLLLAGLLVGGGCATDAGRSRGIDSLHVFGVPVALDLDGTPGPDSFGLTLYASAATVARGVPIKSGQVSIRMYDGATSPGTRTNTVPLRVWTFTAADLKDHVVKSSLGTGYRFTPRWTDTPPSGSHITVLVRFEPSRETSIQSSPTTIAVTAK